ncbi:TonB-dependent receptor [Niveispirillum sp. BGYR6]|uniref:TonB-dependent receptor plug domain-containing protein n=1 Tax=Niveispirillum sp. BGYR6 TaxID=2971249 RepID=UPI0022B99C9F|nr:TonB-dependent receptor [Niveispirillum sp. BGYR6]MDG5496452.1 TonB-dependent receptor [Niveispirillum sp. BGYR6]
MMMSNRTRTLRGLLLLGVAVGSIGTLGAPALAQSSNTEEAMSEIVVVGSRIRRDTFNSPSPIQVLTKEDSVLAGMNSTAEMLQNAGITSGSAQINNAYGNFVTNGGPGANTVGLRGLGAGRTLVLINGRRVAPAGTRGSIGSADLNVLPNAMIERVEVLRDGASSIYGSDAIAGVINVVTLSNVEGVTVDGRYTRPVHNGGEEARASIVGGTSGDRWKVAGSFEYYERGNLTLADRDWTRCNTDYQFNPTTGARLDFVDPMTGQPKCYPISGTGSNGSAINSIGTNNLAGVGAPGSVGSTFNRWRPNGAVSTGLVGFEGVGGGANNLNVRDTFAPEMLNRSLISPVKTYTGFGQASYELEALGNAEVYTEALYNRRESTQTSYRQLALDYAKGSLLIPTGLQGSTFSSVANALTNKAPVGVRAFIGFGNDRSEQDVDFYKSTTGIRGDFTPLDGWRYDLSFSYSKSDATYRQQSFLTDRLAQSLNVVAAPAGFNASLVRPGANGGLVTCAANIANPSLGCIPAPVLNTATIGGKLPQDWSNQVFQTVTGHTKYDEKVASLGLDGPLFTVPAGTVQGAFGAEYREAKIDDTPDINSQTANLYNLTSSAPTRGTDKVYELFGEVEVPVLANLPLVEELTVTGSGRYTEYDSYGSDWTYKVGGVYAPTSWMSLRSSYGTSFRAPALFEQFLGTTTAFLSSQSDPCNNYGAAGKTATLRANCASEGIGPDYQATNGVQVNSGGGSGTGLEAETSKNFTAGLILQPELPGEFGRFSFAVDYFDIKIDNSVERIGGTEILGRCYESADFRRGSNLCRLVSARAAGTNALTVSDSYTNIASSLTRGLDFTARYNVEAGPGDLGLNGTLTYFIDQKSKTFSDQPFIEYNGTLNQPKYSLNADLTYKIEEWSFRYGFEWISGTDSYDLLDLNPATDPRIAKVSDYDLHHLSMQYKGEDWSVTAGVRNIFDRDPPKISAGLTGTYASYSRVGNSPLYSGYDYVGRRVFINLSKSF